MNIGNDPAVEIIAQAAAAEGQGQHRAEKLEVGGSVAPNRGNLEVCAHPAVGQGDAGQESQRQ